MAVVIPDYELSFNNREEGFMLPVNPDDPPEIYTPGNNQNWVTTDVGTFKAIGYKGLQSFSLSFWLPKQSYPSFAKTSNYPGAEQCVEMIERWQDSRRPIRVIITGFLNDAYAIEGFSKKQQIATGDIYCTLDLERYRFSDDANPQTGNHLRPEGSTDTGDTLTAFVTLEYGQTLCELADKYLGDSDRYKEIADLNGIEDVGHPWAWANETDPPRAIQIVCEAGTHGYESQKNTIESGGAWG